MLFRVLLYRMSDIAQPGPGADDFHALEHGLMTYPAQALRQYRSLADKKHFAGITMIAVLDDGNIDIDNVSVFQHPLARYPVAYLMIHRSADGLGETLIVEGSRYRLLLVDNVIVANFVQFRGCDPDSDMGLDHFQYFCRQTSGSAHFPDFFRCFYGDCHSN